MTHRYIPPKVPMLAHDPRSAEPPLWSSPAATQPAPSGLNHVMLRGHLEREGKLSRRGPRDTLIYEGDLSIPDPTAAEGCPWLHTVPFYATGHHAEHLHQLARSGDRLELHGVVHQERWENRSGHHLRTRIKALRYDRLDPALPDLRPELNQVTLGGTFGGIGEPLEGAPNLRTPFILSVESRYLLKNGTLVVHVDQLNLHARGELARQLSRSEPGSLITVLAAAFNRRRHDRRALSFFALSVQDGLLPTWIN